MRPNVMIVILDACRRDALGPYRHTREPSQSHPILEALSREGLVVDDCQSTSSCTTLSVGSLLTGVGPHRHGLVTLVGASLDEGVTTLAARFAQAGYSTAFFPSSAVLNRTTGLYRGFQFADDAFLAPLYDDLAHRPLDLPLFRRHFYQPPTTRTVMGSLRFCEVTTEQVVAWMRRTPDPWLAVVHFIEPHYPYWPPPPWRVVDDPLDRRNYEASIRYVDAVAVAWLVDVLRSRGSETLLIVTSDHGEYFGTHGFRPTGDHGDLYQDVLAVPLIMWGWGLDRLRFAREAPWSHLDLAPTLLGLVGLPNEGLDGVDRSRSDEERPRPSWEDAAFDDPAHAVAMGGLRRGGVAVRVGRYKLIRRAPGLGEPELYDLATDPHETRNLVDLAPEVVRRLSLRLPPRLEMRQESSLYSRRLAALGYL